MTLPIRYAVYETARSGHASTVANAYMQEMLKRLAYTGSGGVITLDTGYVPVFIRIESSPSVVRLRGIERTSHAGGMEDKPGFSTLLLCPVVEQMQELQAALSLNKSQLAHVLKVTRPTLYEWLRGKEPNHANSERLHALLRCLVRTRASATNPLNARFTRQPVDIDGLALLDLLTDEQLDEDRVVNAIRQVQELGVLADRRSADREKQLRDLGFEEPGREQRRKQLARNVALQSSPDR